MDAPPAAWCYDINNILDSDVWSYKLLRLYIILWQYLDCHFFDGFGQDIWQQISMLSMALTFGENRKRELTVCNIIGTRINFRAVHTVSLVL